MKTVWQILEAAAPKDDSDAILAALFSEEVGFSEASPADGGFVNFEVFKNLKHLLSGRLQGYVIAAQRLADNPGMRLHQ